MDIYVSRIYIIMLAFGLLSSMSSFSQVTIASQSFDSGGSGYTDDLGYTVSSGTLVTLDNTTSLSAPNSLRFTGTSNSYTDVEFNNVNISAYTNVTITISFKSVSVENNEDLNLDISYNNGSSYTSTKLIDGQNGGGGESWDWGQNDNDGGAVGTNPYTFNVSNGNTQVKVRVTSDNLDTGEYFYIDNILIEGDLITQEIEIQGNSTEIVNADVTPDVGDGTDWGSVLVGTTTSHTFTIYNTSIASTTLTVSDNGSGISFTSNPSGYFAISAEPTQNSTISGGATGLDFVIDYNPLIAGTHTAIVSIDNDDSDEDPYTFTITGTAVTPTPEIDVTSLGTYIIGDGTNTPSAADNTDFGTAQITTQTITKTFTIENNGTGNLTLGAISLSGPSDFTIDSKPTSGTVIAPGGTADVVISFITSSEGYQTDLLTIASDDSDEASYQINIKARGYKIFFDSDNDGVFDDVDIDDDNDGILDSDEELSCRASPISYSVNYKFLEETFGTGSRTTINTTYNAVSSYCYEDGTVGTNTADCSSLSSPDLNDGEYAVNSESGSAGFASWAPTYWHQGSDHTGDTNGRMAIFNAAIDPGIFYTAHISGALPNVPITYSFWVLNLDRTDAPDINNRLRPNILVEFRDMSDNVLASMTTGDIAPTTAGNMAGDWYQFTADLTLGVNEFQVIFINNQLGGLGNDLALDDIEIAQTLCDFDNDGIADIFDLDSDNDGIPDVVEAGLASYSEGKATLTDVSSWVDANNNGMHDAIESNIALDTDGDGVPDYLDLDSDNDGLFDVDEYGVINNNDTSYQNGDGDVTGDGVGDGPESETFREKDANGDEILEGFGDGILDTYDFFEGNTDYSDSFGNNSQGTGPLYALDSDNDGIPDYRDVYNDLTGIYDIDTVEIYAVLPHTNGVLDDTTDADGDGVMSSRDGDDTIFGSPRNLDASYSLYFDGRNDYVEDTNVIASGDATLMAFVKTDGANATGDDQIIAGQDDFYLIIDSATNIVSVYVEGTTSSSSTAITNGIWTHITATTKSGETILYVNGYEEATDSSGGITDVSNFTIGRASANTNYFKGEIDEVRVFDIALTEDEIKKMVYQELDDTNNFNSGKIIPTDISASIGSALVKYYKMDAYKDDVLDDKKTGSIDLVGATMYNIKDIYFQRAPLPYETSADGNWSDTGSWTNGTEWDIMSKQDNPNDASIVHIKHNIDLDGSYDTQGMVGLIVDNTIEFSIEADKGLYNSWYLKLDGMIDLDGESQLIQEEGSILDVTSAGVIERDQQGTKDLFTYNYWSSPVGTSNTISNNNAYTLPDILNDGAVASNPLTITFLTSGYNGDPGTPGSTPISIADYWIWKYNNRLSDDYPSWQHVRSTGTLFSGEGFTMKGVANTGGAITQEQNYVFNGKPNNGDITLTLSAGNDYLVGNPYASAIDADEFIKDNISVGSGGRAATNVINGTLYFWDHFASSTHILSAYQGGYATYNLMGGTTAISNDVRINNNGAIGTKSPEQYIPVSQGFFVVADTGGDVTFKNSQRIFKTEATDPSLFIKSSTAKAEDEIANAKKDLRQKFKLMFDSPEGYHRQLLTGVDINATNGYDIGYDAPLIENNNEDLFWLVADDKFVIQGVNNFNDDQALPLGIKLNKEGLATIKIDSLINITDNLEIYLHDKELDIYHNLKTSDYQINLTKGEHLERFEITFVNLVEPTPEIENEEVIIDDAIEDIVEIEDTESIDIIDNIEDTEEGSLAIHFANESKSIVVDNPSLKQIQSTEIYNILGQTIYTFNNSSSDSYMSFKTPQITAGVYIIKIKTDKGIVSQKVLVK